ncbi:MAG: ABC transporter permease [Erysipelotrichaceae bacterium]
MKILHRYGIKNLWHNYKRTIAIMIGITLSTAMMISIATLTLSAKDALQTKQRETFGDYHSLFYNVPNDKKIFVTHNEKVAEAMQVQSLGVDYLNGSKNNLKPYISVMGFQQTTLDHLPVKLSSGRLPKNDHEIILAKHILYNGKVNLNLGEQIQLNLGKRIFKDSLAEINNFDPYYEGVETIQATKLHTYQVVGFFERPTFENFSSASYSAITAYNETLPIASDIYVKYYNPSDSVKNTKAIAKVIKFDDRQYNFNYNLLTYDNALANSRSSFLINIVSVFTMIVVLLGSATLLYNSFSMNMRKERQHLSMLQSVGATMTQIRSMLFFQGFIIALISIPLGIGLGLLSVSTSLGIFNQLILSSSIEMSAMKLHLSWSLISICSILIFILIEFCIWLPSKTIALSLIDEMKIKGNAKAKKYRMDQKHSSITSKLAIKHLCFQKHSERNILISLVTLIVLFVSFHGLMSNVQKVRDESFLDSKYDVSMNFTEERNNLNIANEIAQLETVNTNIITTYEDSVLVPLKAFNKKYQNTIKGNSNQILVDIIGIEDNKFDALFKENKTNAEHQAYLYNEYQYSNNHPSQYIDATKKIAITHGKTVDFEVIPTTIDLGFLNQQSRPTLLVRSSKLDQLFQNEFKVKDESQFNKNYIAYFNTLNSNALETELKNLPGLNRIVAYDINNYDRMNGEVRSIKLLTNLLFFGFITLVFIVGFVNILNTAHGEYQMRRQEFAMLNSIGMRKKDILKMLYKESLMEAIIAFLIAFVINVLIASILSFFFQKAGIGYDMAIPYMDYLYCLLIGFSATCMVLGYQIIQRRKDSIADIIKEQSI